MYDTDDINDMIRVDVRRTLYVILNITTCYIYIYIYIYIYMYNNYYNKMSI